MPLQFKESMVGEGFEEFVSVFVEELLQVHLLEKDARTWQALLKEAGESFFVGALVSGIVQGASRLGNSFAHADLSPRELGEFVADAVHRELRDPTLGAEEIGEPRTESTPEERNDKILLDKSTQALYNKREKFYENIQRGIRFADELRVPLRLLFPSFGSEVTIKMPSGLRFRADYIGRMEEGGYVIFEFKASQKPRLSKNQREAFQELQTSAGIVVGRGKPGFEGGTRIPPISEGTRIIIKSPNNTKLIGQELDEYLWKQIVS